MRYTLEEMHKDEVGSPWIMKDGKRWSYAGSGINEDAPQFIIDALNAAEDRPTATEIGRAILDTPLKSTEYDSNGVVMDGGWDRSMEDSRLLYEGRKIAEALELGVGYCGSCSFETHVEQLNNPEHWVHSSVKRWRKAASSELHAQAQATAALNEGCSPIGWTDKDLGKLASRVKALEVRDV